MSKRAKITGTYRISSEELVQFTVDVASSYPDALAEAKSTVLSLLHEELADVLHQQYGKDRDTQPVELVWPEQDAE
jgi:hypothetical protein